MSIDGKEFDIYIKEISKMAVEGVNTVGRWMWPPRTKVILNLWKRINVDQTKSIIEIHNYTSSAAGSESRGSGNRHSSFKN